MIDEFNAFTEMDTIRTYDSFVENLSPHFSDNYLSVASNRVVIFKPPPGNALSIIIDESMTVTAYSNNVEVSCAHILQHSKQRLKFVI